MTQQFATAMMRTFRAARALPSGLLVIACLPVSVSPQARATEFERLHCVDNPQPRELRTFEASRVLAVEPLLRRVHTANNNYEARTIGASLTIRLPSDITAEQLHETLQCHGAHALLGQLDARRFPNDPYFLPDTWLEVSVEPDAGNFNVAIAADNVHDGLLVLQRAKEYAAARAQPR